MLILPEVQYDFDDVMFLPQLANPTKNLGSRSNIDVTRTFKPGYNRVKEWTGTPIIAANMDTIGTMEMAEVLFKYNCCTALHKHYATGELVEFYKMHEGDKHLLFYTMGISETDICKFNNFIKQYGEPDNICIDVANGYLPGLAKAVSYVRSACPDSMIMAGNVVTSDAVYNLVNAGASIIKVGIGSGSACTTRKMTGVGRPQLSAVIECANTAHSMGALICSDGGCVDPSHITKAIGGGADFVMLGGMLSGHDECGGRKVLGTPTQVMVDEYYMPVVTSIGRTEVIYGKRFPTGHSDPNSVLSREVPDGDFQELGNSHFKEFIPNVVEKVIGMEFYGMSSTTAMDKYSDGVASYKASEGRTLVVPYKGMVSETIELILGSMRSTMTYIGAERVKDISKCTTFVKVNSQLNTSLVQYESKE